jgi:streptomycin 6-kinase
LAASSIDALPRHWNIYYPTLVAETFSSRIWRVKLADGSSAIVKALNDFPDVYDELRGAHYLRWRDGVGAVRLLAEHERMMLLEDAGSLTLQTELDRIGDTESTAIAAEATARLLTSSDAPAPADLQPLRQRFKELFDIAREADARPIYVEAARMAIDLLDTTQREAPLHGDLHHENLLWGERGWLAIDPKGVLGDPAFDAANWLYNPLDRDDLCLSEERIAGIASTFAKTLDIDPRRILDFAFAYGCLSAAWHAGDDNSEDEDRELAVAAAVRAVRLSF